MDYQVFLKAHSMTTGDIFRFLYDAYFYAEEPIDGTKIFTMEHDLSHGRMIINTIVEDYIIDVLAGRCLPQTQKLIERIGG